MKNTLVRMVFGGLVMLWVIAGPGRAADSGAQITNVSFTATNFSVAGVGFFPFRTFPPPFAVPLFTNGGVWTVSLLPLVSGNDLRLQFYVNFAPPGDTNTYLYFQPGTSFSTLSPGIATNVDFFFTEPLPGSPEVPFDYEVSGTMAYNGGDRVDWNAVASAVAVPEPGTWALLALGAGSWIAWSRRRTR